MSNIILKDKIANNTQILLNVKLCRVHSHHCKLQTSLLKSKHSVSIEEQKYEVGQTYVTKIPNSSVWSIFFPNTNNFY
jgi:hypothetical protein